MSVRGQLSEEQLLRLEGIFAGRAPWSFEHYQPLRAFSHALPRLNLPDLPALLNFGDVLEALDEHRADTVAPWPTHESVSESTFEELGYARTSAAITRIRDANAAAWREHGLCSKALLLRGAECAQGARAVVVGAGKLYDTPLRKLAERFEQLVLVDIDAAALVESVRRVGLKPKLQARLTLVATDVTGINDVFMEKARAALDLSGDVAVYEGLLRVLYEYRVAEPPRLVPSDTAIGPFDFACSSMVLSQLATPLTSYLQEQFRARFPTSGLIQVSEFQLALAQFTHRVQQSHVRALLSAAPFIALSSDVDDRYTTTDLHGAIRGAAPLPLIGAPSLIALLPRQRARIVSSAAWQWQHVVPSRVRPHGRTVQVEGVVAQRM